MGVPTDWNRVFVFYTYGASHPLVIEFMRDGRTLVRGDERAMYIPFAYLPQFLAQLNMVPVEDLELNEGRHPDALIV